MFNPEKDLITSDQRGEKSIKTKFNPLNQVNTNQIVQYC